MAMATAMAMVMAMVMVMAGKSEVRTMSKRDELANLEADYFSNIQFPPTWVETGTKDLKQDVNAARRKRCFDDHKLGFQKGYDAREAEVKRLREALAFVKSELAAINNYDETRFKHMAAWQVANKALAETEGG